MNKHKTQPIIITSHRRSGTHLTIDAFRTQFYECRSWKFPLERIDRLYLNLNSMQKDYYEKTTSHKTACRILSRTSRPLIKTHLLPPLQVSRTIDPRSIAFNNMLNNAKTIYVYRDFRSVVCSYWLFRKKFDPNADVSLCEFLRQNDSEGKTYITRWREHILAWRNEPNVTLLKFEDLTQNTTKTLLDIANKLHLSPINEEPYLPKPWKNILESRIRGRVMGIRPRATTILGRKRFDDKVSWKTVFSDDDHSYINEHLGDLLTDLGYTLKESSLINPSPPSSS